MPAPRLAPGSAAAVTACIRINSLASDTSATSRRRQWTLGLKFPASNLQTPSHHTTIEFLCRDIHTEHLCDSVTFAHLAHIHIGFTATPHPHSHTLPASARLTCIRTPHPHSHTSLAFAYLSLIRTPHPHSHTSPAPAFAYISLIRTLHPHSQTSPAFAYLSRIRTSYPLPYTPHPHSHPLPHSHTSRVCAYISYISRLIYDVAFFFARYKLIKAVYMRGYLG